MNLTSLCWFVKTIRKRDVPPHHQRPSSRDIFERRAYLDFVLVVRSKIIRIIFTPAGRVSRDTLHYPRRGYSFMGKTKAPATLTVPGLFAIS